jgi:hypothetical protein
MSRFGFGPVGPRPEPPPGPPGPPARRRPERCAARRASARPPYEGSGAPPLWLPVDCRAPYWSDPVDRPVPYDWPLPYDPPPPRGGGGRRPAGGGGCAPRRLAARPPPFDCGGLRRCSLILPATPQVRRSRLKAAVVFRSPRNAAPPGHTTPRTMTPLSVPGFPMVSCRPEYAPPNPSVVQPSPHNGQLASVKLGCDGVHHDTPCEKQMTVLSSRCIDSIHRNAIRGHQSEGRPTAGSGSRRRG